MLTVISLLIEEAISLLVWPLTEDGRRLLLSSPVLPAIMADWVCIECLKIGR